MNNYLSAYIQQVTLLVRLLTSVRKESCFALKGGTAINLFYRDLPRLSVDIDLTYLPYQDRATSLTMINDSLQRIAHDIEQRNNGIWIHFKRCKINNQIQKIITGNIERIKIEPNDVLRCHLYPTELRQLSPTAESILGMTIDNIPTLSFHEVYAGKIVAALDRQHPRDLFDIAQLYQHEGIDEKMLDAFVIYVACSPRPINEILNPNEIDIKQAYNNEFVGMTSKPTSYDELINIRQHLIFDIRNKLTQKQKDFLIGIKSGKPDYRLMPFQNLDQFPALIWKINNTQKMDVNKRKIMLEKLHKVLQM